MLPSIFCFSSCRYLQFSMKALIPVLIKSSMLTHCLCLNNRAPKGSFGNLKDHRTHTQGRCNTTTEPNYTPPIFLRVKLQLCVVVAQSNWLLPDLTGGPSERWAYHALPVTADTNHWMLIVHDAAWPWKGRVRTTNLWPFKTNYGTCHWLRTEEINAIENTNANKRKINISLRPTLKPEGFVISNSCFCN